jgi:DnaD/phage-associated family protein
MVLGKLSIFFSKALCYTLSTVKQSPSALMRPERKVSAMSHLTIYQSNYVDATVVSNLFIDEYMKDANDAQIKVYLYLLRMMNAREATSVSDIADKFNHTEKDILRALKYWEKQRLLDLDYDSGKNLSGIHIRDLSGNDKDKAVSVPQPEPSFIPLPASSPSPELGSSKAFSALRSQEAPMPPSQETPQESSPYEKPSYSADQLREFKSREETALLLSIAESYIGKPLTPSEIKTILYFTDVLRFSDDLIDYLIQYCVDRGKKDFKYIERVAVNWAESGITTPKQAQKASSRYDKNVYTIMNGLGKDASPTVKEMEYITRWTKDYGFSTDIIVEACQRTVLATDKHRFEYAEGILSSWKRQDVHHKSDIAKIDSQYQQRKKPSPKQPANRFNQFTQNTYDFEALEQELLSN